MRGLFAATVVSLFSAMAYGGTLQIRDPEIWQSPFSGTIVAPAADDVLVPGGANFTFKYQNSNWCESAYSPFIVYLSEGPAPPAFENVTVNGTLAEGTYVLGLGQYLISNFGLPLPDGYSSPPSSLYLPPSVPTDVDTQRYITVLQEFNGCPGHIAVEYSLTSVPVTLDDGDGTY